MSFVQSVRKASPISSFPSARTRFGKRYLSLPTIAERVSLEVENFSWPKSPTFFKASSTEGQAQPRSTALQRDPGGLTRSILTVRLYLVHLANSAFTGRRGKAVFIVLGVLLFLATTACFLADVSIDCRAVDVGTPAISDILRTSEPPRVTLKANPSRRSDNDDNEVVPFVTQDSFLSTTPTEQRSPSSGFFAWLSHAVSPLMLMQAANVPRVSTHAIPIFPPSASLSPSVSPHHVVFVFATTVQRIRQYAPLWLHWLQPLQNCIVLVNGAGGTDRDETQRYLSSDLGLKKCQVVANGQKQAHNDFAANLLMAAGTAADMDWSDWYGKRIQPKYLVLLPDDALVGDEKAIRAILGENPSGKERISESLMTPATPMTPCRPGLMGTANTSASFVRPLILPVLLSYPFRSSRMAVCGEDFAVPNVCTGHQGVLMTFSLARLISNRLERCLGSLPKHDNLWASCFKSASGDNQDLKMRLMSTMSGELQWRLEPPSYILVLTGSCPLCLDRSRVIPPPAIPAAQRRNPHVPTRSGGLRSCSGSLPRSHDFDRS